MKTLTVFTPTYNRKHTLSRTYDSIRHQSSHDVDWLIIDDGSSDGTREWVESLGSKVASVERGFDWMGRCQNKNEDCHFFIESSFEGKDPLFIEYIYKPNGGLYTGYNVAYQTIQTELCVCIDSDDFMPDDAVEKIVDRWTRLTDAEKKINCGITGLDFNVVDKKPIGGFFPENICSIFFNDLRLKKLHSGDTKQVFRTELVRKVAPMEGFMGEKNFNPIFMMIQVMDMHPMILMNENLCWVEYQTGIDSMSQGIFKQYVNSPQSFAKMRMLEMVLVHNTTIDRFRSAVHYVSSCMIAKDRTWLTKSPRKLLTILALPFGCLLFFFINLKNRK